jgi:hypothetical protein
MSGINGGLQYGSAVVSSRLSQFFLTIADPQPLFLFQAPSLHDLAIMHMRRGGDLSNATVTVRGGIAKTHMPGVNLILLTQAALTIITCCQYKGPLDQACILLS